MPRQPKPPPRIVPDTTLVVDNGAHTIKAGFATDAADPDVDCRQIPNCLARSRDKRVWIGAQLEHCKDFGEMSFRRPVEKGYLVNWEAEKEIWDESFFSQKAVLKCDPHETNLILTEAPNALPALQSNTDQMIFEEFEFASYYRCTGPTLNSYNDIQAIYHASYPPDSPSHQTEAILVVDSGYSHTTINPLLNNRPIHAAVRRLDIGGKFLTNYLKELVSMRHYDMMDETHLMNQVKEAVCYVSSDFTADLDRTWKGPVGDRRRRAPHTDSPADNGNGITVDYVLPDYNTHTSGFVRAHDTSHAAKLRKLNGGGVAASSTTTSTPTDPAQEFMTLGNERFVVPELLFRPGDIGMEQAGIAELITHSLATLPGALWPALLANVVVVGGNAHMPGFVERLSTDLRKLVPAECTLRVGKPSNPTTSSFTGGVHLARQRDATRALVVTRAEYQEHGGGWVARRFAGGGGGGG